MTNNQSPSETFAAISWRDDKTPVSDQFDDPYFSLSSGLEETRHVFLAGNDLPARLTEGFHIAELGFGTGLNMLALALICPPDVSIDYTSFEAYPMDVNDVAMALSAFPEVEGIALQFLDAWRAGDRRFQVGALNVEVVEGDARNTLAAWPHAADAWFLDGFSPAKNPELWGEDLMLAVGARTRPGGTFATYTAAGHVRRALTAAGFDVERVSGFGRKRHMSRGRKAP